MMLDDKVAIIDDRASTLEALGAFVRGRRLELGLTQAQLADRLGWVQERISLIEHGKYGMPSLPALSRLAAALECTLADVLHAAGYLDADAVIPHDGNVPSTQALLYTLRRLLHIEPTDLREALNEASTLVAGVMGADKIDAFIYDPSTETLVAMGSSDTPVARKQHQLGLDRMPIANRGPLVEAFETATIYHTGHADQDLDLPPGVREALGIRSMIAVPLWVQGTVRGLLSAESTETERFSAEDRLLFEAVARWVGIIAHRAELMSDVARTAAEAGRRGAAEELITLLAHDLGNHLTPLKGHIDVVLRRLGREDRAQDVRDLQVAARAVGRIQRLVGDLLDVARLDHGLLDLSSESVDLVQIAQETIAELEPLDHRIATRVPSELIVQGDAERLRQVLENLLSNAIQHSPDGLPIEVALKAETREDGEWAVVAVQDTGPGIAPETLSTLFERFSPGPSSSGLGLGLFLARSIVQAHGGMLTADSPPDQGARFSMSLPMCPAADGVE